MESQRAMIRGRAAGQVFDFEAQVVGRSDQEAYLVTESEPPHRARISVRHQGGVLSGRPYTTCGFEWDGQYIALATYTLMDDGTALIEPEDY